MRKKGRIRAKERDAILQSLKAGVVPRVGQQHIQVGRAGEVAALVRDIERIADGGSAIRFIIGEYGSGKTFFLHLVRSIALEKKMVTVHADLSPDRRIHSTGGHARALYGELMSNAATRTKPEGGALPSIVERFISSAMSEGRRKEMGVEEVLHERLERLSELPGGYDFAQVIAAYWRGHDTGNEQLKADAVRWLRAEFSTRTDARRALGVRTIIDDGNFYDQLRLTARFVTLAGYAGLLVNLDEMVNLYKLASTQARKSNYEQILRILNDCLQGTAANLGFLFGGTPEFLMDTRRGLYSYAALQTRLGENTFARGDLVDYSGPVLRLGNLTPEDILLLLHRLRHVFASGDESAYLVPDDALKAFMLHCQERIGEAYFRTPRSSITAFANLLSVLEQNPGADWRQLLGGVDLAPDADPEFAPIQEEGEPDNDVGKEASGAVNLEHGADPNQDDDELVAFKL